MMITKINNSIYVYFFWIINLLIFLISGCYSKDVLLNLIVSIFGLSILTMFSFSLLRMTMISTGYKLDAHYLFITLNIFFKSFIIRMFILESINVKVDNSFLSILISNTLILIDMYIESKIAKFDIIPILKLICISLGLYTIAFFGIEKLYGMSYDDYINEMNAATSLFIAFVVGYIIYRIKGRKLE